MTASDDRVGDSLVFENKVGNRMLDYLGCVVDDEVFTMIPHMCLDNGKTFCDRETVDFGPLGFTDLGPADLNFDVGLVGDSVGEISLAVSAWVPTSS